MVGVLNFLRSLFNREPVRLAIVRKYQDANGAYIGELYMYDNVALKNGLYVGYTMIGASLDTLPFSYTDNDTEGFILDAKHDFLRLPMLPNTVRVGGLTPSEDIAIRRRIYALRRKPIELTVANKFIEHVLDKENA